jgi:hypothetical protein
MTNHDGGRDSVTASSGVSNKSQTIKDVASDAFAKVTGAAREAGAKTKEAASDTATTVTDHFKDVLDKQIGNNIAAAGVIASSVKRAADDIDLKSPIAASIVRNLADRVEQFAAEYDDETVEQLTRSASDFTRRQPALVLGLAAVTGFLMFRAISNAPAAKAPPIQPEDAGPAT